jgi:thioredoxin reductase
MGALMPLETYDVVIAGGGPAGLAAALTLGRARKRVLLCDAGPRRNAAAVHVHNFVTRDGITPDEFRRIGRAQLEPYSSVEVRDVRVDDVRGARGAFDVQTGAGDVRARRVILCGGMIDELPEMEGFRELWGTSIFQCPYCHGWEVQDRRFGYLLSSPARIEFALFLRGWTHDVVLFTNGEHAVPPETRARFDAAGVRVDERRIARLAAAGDRLERIEFADGAAVERDVLFAHPPQRQIDLVGAIGLSLDAAGFVAVDPVTRETSVPGIYAAGDLASGAQGALMAAAAGSLAASMANHALTPQLAVDGLLR